MQEPHALDLVGVGFGPSNLGLAIALDERTGPALSMRFLERQERFGWHRGMLLEDATMQVSYLKDLVTLRNPASGYGFLSYLHERGRLADFINYGSPFPTRIEFHDYLEWAAAGFADRVDYGAEVQRIAAVPGEPGLLEVHASHATRGATSVRTRNVVLATGLVPQLPEGVRRGPRVWHSSELLTRVDSLHDPRRVVVVGAGQSAAEALDHLHRTFPAAEVRAVFSRFGYSPADDTPFANRVFDPSAVDAFHRAPSEVKGLILGYHGNTNYSVVDPELIESLYRRHYHERVSGRERLRFHNVSRVADAIEVDGRVELAVESMVDGGREVLSADLVVYATGYRSSDPARMLGALADSCLRDEEGRLRVERDYRVATRPEIGAGIYLQGATEHSHGLSSTLLSTVATRSGEIADAIAAATGAQVPAWAVGQAG
ncbi:lysine N(6)-hydroxylase/L-ornithine N(5)-oxygenase family protein [Pseudonocardia sp. MH-G8]|uniref:lysine N(6)-hydroxylase/L-ornithine N(5)-oxygenase family protein n=1 Tax=Pseudonocardia sp. MH-G8 TaxID=1854588 RepID=UPI000BA11177|nr:lysine N(6)-hydroxylase/L-ornithine N(5)-oxygenase family protein [Pseudonocardia sp. MH-G8]OZM81544.1 L-lysine 6-monooxygenase [Pseudonocardia sp. MH-G8]